MLWWLKTHTVSVKDPGSIPCTHIVAPNTCNYSSGASDALSDPYRHHAPSHTDTYN